MAERSSRHLSRNRAAGLPPAAARMLDQAWAALSRKQLDSAESSLIGVMALVPSCVEARRLLGEVQHVRGDHAQAIANLRQALTLSPDDALTLTSLGNALCSSGAIDTAMPVLQRACELAPDMTKAWFNLGRACRQNFDPDSACTALQRVLDLDPAHIPARVVLAEVQTSLGDIADAGANYRELLRQRPAYADAWIGLANLRTEPLSADDVTTLRRALQSPEVSNDARVKLGFALASALEAQAEYAAAFEALSRANALKHRQVHWDPVAAHAQIDAIETAFSAPTSSATDKQLGHQVIFLVCLPRSGSTLVEQILASHPQVEGADELTDLLQVVDAESERRGQAFPQWVGLATPDDWQRMGQDYLARTERWQQRRPFFTDKNVLNWQWVGAVLAMMPGARVVNCRRDPVENCFGCYRQLFARGSYFSYNFADIAAYWRDYDRLSRHWQKLFPTRFFEHSYEALLGNPERQVRRLLEFCELPYDPACLEFHRTRRVVRTASAGQVREPLQRGVARSAHYADQLEPLRELLGDTSSAP